MSTHPPQEAPKPQEAAEQAFARCWKYECDGHKCHWGFRHQRLFSAVREFMGLAQTDWPSLIFWLSIHDLGLNHLSQSWDTSP